MINRLQSLLSHKRVIYFLGGALIYGLLLKIILDRLVPLIYLFPPAPINDTGIVAYVQFYGYPLSAEHIIYFGMVLAPFAIFGGLYILDWLISLRQKKMS